MVFTLEHWEGACVRSISNTPSIATSSIRLHLKAFPLCCCTKVFKILTEVANPGITVKNNTGSDHVRKRETKRIESEKECKELIPNILTKLRNKTLYMYIWTKSRAYEHLLWWDARTTFIEKAWCVMIRLSHWEIRQLKKWPRYFGHRMFFFLLPASPCESISIYLYIYIYNIESVSVKKYFNDHIYLSRHDGFRKGWGIHHGRRAQRGNAEGRLGKKCEKNLGWNKCLSKGGTNRIFTNIFHFQGVTSDIDGCHNPISSLVPSPNSSHHHAHQCLMALSSTCLLDPCYLASWAWWVLPHMSLALGV